MRALKSVSLASCAVIIGFTLSGCSNTETTFCPTPGEDKAEGPNKGFHDRFFVATGPGFVEIEMKAGGGNIWIATEKSFLQKEPQATDEAQAEPAAKFTTLSSDGKDYPKVWSERLADHQYLRYRSTHSSELNITTKSNDRAGFICKNIDKAN
ncbi:MAG: hypothetical protein NWR87_05125 [Rhodospirillales bacterium]|nr:hypothetical protein [Rhodospirillales bacterium]